MKLFSERLLFALMISASLCFSACTPDDLPDNGEDDKEEVRPPWHNKEENEDSDPTPTPDPVPDTTPSYNNLDAYDHLKNYVNRTVSPDFKLGAAVTVSNFLKKTQEYSVVTQNFNEMTAGNAMKQASILRRDGSMDFTQVRSFLDAAEQAGMTVYGHTLAWHAQQSNDYLNGLIKGKKVEVPDGTGEDIMLSADFIIIAGINGAENLVFSITEVEAGISYQQSAQLRAVLIDGAGHLQDAGAAFVF